MKGKNPQLFIDKRSAHKAQKKNRKKNRKLDELDIEMSEPYPPPLPTPHQKEPKMPGEETLAGHTAENKMAPAFVSERAKKFTQQLWDKEKQMGTW